jgi:hypothetical protein
MTKRTYSDNVNPANRDLVDSLFALDAPETSEYQIGMQRLGNELGTLLIGEIPQGTEHVCVACTVEDADFLARGIIDALESNQRKFQVSLACFWNEKSIDVCDMEDFDIAPILKSYKEPTEAKSVLVVAKSIISGGCVVATNIINLLDELNPSEIFIAAPVMVAGSKHRLEVHFSTEILDRFKYVTFALQTDRGEGKSIYERYGWSGSEDKNMYLPKLVRERRSRFATSP